MRDFVTYSRAEFNLGPSLNMIIGPNGTGKSTLVCAICLGLSGKPELLGRAKDIGDFVKMGCKSGSVEIELRGHPGERNPVIERTIYPDNRSEWSLFGKRETAKKIKEIIDSFNVQIDNLCQFLPQDKVAEFAHMTPQRLLIETERAAGSPSMLPQHERLIELNNEYKLLTSSNDKNANELASLSTRQEAAAGDVERYKRREVIKKQLELLERLIPFVEYQDMKDMMQNAKRAYDEKNGELEVLRGKAGPSLKLFEDAKALCDESAAEVEATRRSFEDVNGSLQRTVANRDALATQFDEHKQQIAGLVEERAQRAANLQTMKTNLARWLESHAKEQPDEAARERATQQLRDATAETRRIQGLQKATGDQMTDARVEIRQTEKKMEDVSAQMRALESEANRKLQNLQRIDRDTYEAVLWLRQHRDTFEDNVYEPPYLTISVKDPSLTDAVEGTVRRSALLTFTCLSRNDYLKFTETLIDKMRLNVAVVEFSNTANPDLKSFHPFCSRDELTSYGFEGWLLDFVAGPHPVLTTLCHVSQLHLVAYTRSALSNAQLEAIEQRLEPDGKPSFKSFICDSTSYALTRSLYGSRNIIAQTRRLHPSRYLKDKGVDQNLKRQLMDKLETIQGQIGELTAAYNGMKDTYTRLTGELVEAEKVKREATVEKDKIQKELIAWNRLGTKIDETREQIEAIEGSPDDTDARVAALNEAVRGVQDERTALIAEQVKLLRVAWEAHKQQTASAIRDLKHKNDRDFFENAYRQANIELEEGQVELAELRKTYSRLKKQAKEMYDRLSNDIAGLSAEEQEEMNRLSRETDDDGGDGGRLTLERLNGQIAAARDSLSLIHDGNSHILEQYEQRAATIRRLQQKVNEGNAQSDQIQAEIRTVRAAWEGELDRLVGQISTEFAAAFEFIGCAGEVRVGKPDDYDKWAIEIMVKFRDTEQLQQLTHQRQSGGERSVSTIFYLMSLQGVTKAPFRVVDEINQGMDPRNERMVHSRMVTVACQEHSSQYFLITPKLLPELTYHPRMVVHCIFSGEFMPSTAGHAEDLTLGRLSKYVDVGRQLKQAAVH
ncbi:P-loop containing nucleoside triphosphate hydrolase protein [Dipodascopsis tothii]|uniref:P-loop containing nucleoside triphosphate hydrolase protein n=1 Tax=Dipodascopsis tothii TaxID=44089 RepID=UPI0034CEABD8